MGYSVYYLVEGEPWLSAVKKYREAYVNAYEESRKFAEKYGAKRWWPESRGVKVTSLDLNEAPEGWTKPNKRGTRPKKDTDAYNEMKALPSTPDENEYIGELIKDYPHTLNFKKDDSEGFSRIGNPFFPFQIIYTGENYCVILPDYEKHFAEEKEQSPDIIIKNDDYEFDTTGLKRIIKATWDRIVAQEEEKRQLVD